MQEWKSPLGIYGLSCVSETCHFSSESIILCGASSEFVSLSILSWQILTARAQPFRGARDLAFCLKVPLDSLLVWASSGGSEGSVEHLCCLAWTFAALIGDNTKFAWHGPYKDLLHQRYCSSDFLFHRNEEVRQRVRDNNAKWQENFSLFMVQYAAVIVGFLTGQ